MDNSVLLKIENLRKHYQLRDKAKGRRILRAVDGVSLDINRGETFGLVGESGCGKTTLGRTILRLAEPDGGSIIFDGKDITRVNMRPYRSRMQIIFQNPSGCLDPRSRIKDIVAEGIRTKSPGVSGAQRNERIISLLESVGLDEYSAHRYPHEFSGGQQQRVGIARALAVEPEFIVCDEPLSALDVSYQAQLINLLKELQDKLGLTYLFISHDMSVVRYVSDRVGVMYLGKLVESGRCEDVIQSPAHQYTKALIEAVPIPDPIAGRAKDRKLPEEYADLVIPEKGCRYCRLCKAAQSDCFEIEPEMIEISPGHFCACHFPNYCAENKPECT